MTSNPSSSVVPARKRGRYRARLTKDERDTFLEKLAEGFSVTHAAAEAGRDSRSFYDLREREERFREAWVEAWESGNDLIEDELRRRAFEG